MLVSVHAEEIIEGDQPSTAEVHSTDPEDISLGWLSQYEWLVVREASRFFGGYLSCRDDLLQECRIALLRASELFDEARGIPFGAYAARVVSRAALRFVLQENRRGFSGLGSVRPYTTPKVLSVTPDSGGSKPSLELAAEDVCTPTHWSVNHWSRVFRCLSELQREVVRLRVFKNLSNREVGEILGFRESRASFLWQEALGRLRENRVWIDDV